MDIKEFFKTKLKETGRDVDELIKYLEESDFFVAPASTRYHGSFDGGLAQHSVNVYDCLCKVDDMLYEQYGVPKEDRSSLILCGLLHDLCKTETYVPKQLWRKDANGKWESYQGYEKKTKFPMGHGAKSVFIINEYVRLTPKEAMAIYWHMGPYDLSDYSNANEMSQAFTENTLAYKLHTADMMATYVLENEGLEEVEK